MSFWTVLGAILGFYIAIRFGATPFILGGVIAVGAWAFYTGWNLVPTPPKYRAYEADRLPTQQPEPLETTIEW